MSKRPSANELAAIEICGAAAVLVPMMKWKMLEEKVIEKLEAAERRGARAARRKAAA